MNKQLINIAVLEPSQIIFEGLSNVLSKSGQYFKLIRIEGINEIENLLRNEKLDVAIINPTQIQNKNKEFISLKKNMPDTCWIGLIYTFFDHQLLSLFDKTIGVTDSTETIVNLINRLNNSDSNTIPPIEHEQLSDRETEVLKLLVTGLSNKEIADKLFISIHTVISHRKNITQKTGIKSQSGLTIYAISNKIIHIEDYKL
ncbi:MAG: LuxR C-terminal-related transcriptional regulator [bacterium]